jgi:hypothetical protein
MKAGKLFIAASQRIVSGITLLSLLFLCAESVLATTYFVDAKAQPGATTFNSLSSLLSAVTLRGGDVVKLRATDLYRDRIKFTAQHSGDPGNPVIIESETTARAVWDGSTTDVNQYGYLWSFFPDSHDIEVRRIEVRNVQPGPDDNNRGIQVRGKNITIRECFVHHNPNGIFSTTEAVNTRIERCEIAFNGTGSGYTHNFYMQGTGTYVRYSWIHDANGGINYKDRSIADASGVAAEFSYNWVENASNGGYELDFSLGSAAGGRAQDAVVIGNIIYKSDTGNRTKVTTFGNDGRAGKITLVNNTIIAATTDNALLELGGGATAVLYNNIYYRGEKLTPDGAGAGVTGSNNFLMTGTNAPGLTNTTFGQWPGFVNYDKKDLRLVSNSPLVNAGNTTIADSLQPKFEYVRDTNFKTRTDKGRCLGAYAATTQTGPPLPVNLAASKVVMASSLLGNYAAANAVDNNEATIWHSAVNLLQLEFLQLDLGNPAVITKLEIVFRNDQDQPITRKNFAVYASDDPEFKTGVVRLAARGANATQYQRTWSVTVSETRSFRYVRFTKTALDYDTTGNAYWNLAEARVIGYRPNSN